MIKKYLFMGNGYNFVRIVKRLLGSEFIKEEFDDGVEFIHANSGKRLLKLMDEEDYLMVRFDYPVPNLNKNTEQIQHEHHMHWDYKGTKIDDFVALIEIALENFKRRELNE